MSFLSYPDPTTSEIKLEVFDDDSSLSRGVTKVDDLGVATLNLSKDAPKVGENKTLELPILLKGKPAGTLTVSLRIPPDVDGLSPEELKKLYNELDAKYDALAKEKAAAAAAQSKAEGERDDALEKLAETQKALDECNKKSSQIPGLLQEIEELKKQLAAKPSVPAGTKTEYPNGTTIATGIQNATKFRISCYVKFSNFNANYPIIATTDTGAFQLHGLGPAYGGDRGKVVFYLQTPGSVGSNGRGTGQVRSPKILTLDVWHHVVVEKRARTLSLSLDGETWTVKLPDNITADQFQIKPTGAIQVKKGTGDQLMSGSVADFEISYDVDENGPLGTIVTSQG